MLAPKSFQSWWMRMWPTYFRLPLRKLQLTGDQAKMPEVHPDTPAEEFRVGDAVRALQRIKWEATKDKIDSRRLYFRQTEESGSKRKVQAGARGHVVRFYNGSLVVEWKNWKEELFLIEPSQVVTTPRRVLDPGKAAG